MRAGQRGLEAREVRPALGGVDVVREREDRLDVRAVPLHRDLDLAVLCLALEVHDVLVHGVLRVVHVGHEVADPALVVELLGLAAGALVPQHDPQAAREERGLAQALGQRRRGELRLVEDVRVRQERDRRPRLVLARDADRLHVARRLAAGELLPVQLAVAAHLRHEPLRERVHDRDADAVQAARDLVAVAAELPACVELREHDRQRGEPLVRDHVHRDARAGVANRHRVVRMDGDVDEVVPARESLVDGVVDHLVDEMVEPPRARRADVHPGPETDGLEALEDGDVFCGVGCFGHQKSPANRHIAGRMKCIRNRGRTAVARSGENRRRDSDAAALKGRSAGASEARARGAGHELAELRILDRGGDRRCLRSSLRGVDGSGRRGPPAESPAGGPGSGTGPGRKRSFPGADAPTASRKALGDLAATCGRARTPRWRTRSPRAASRPCARRRGQALRETASPTASRPGGRDLRERESGAVPAARELALDRLADPLHHAARTSPSDTSQRLGRLRRQRSRRRRRDHRLAAFRDDLAQRLSPLGVELREHVVEEDERPDAASLDERVGLRQDESEDGDPLLPLRAVATKLAAACEERDLVEVRPEPGDAPLEVLLEAGASSSAVVGGSPS